jgi:hypothetical protein
MSDIIVHVLPHKISEIASSVGWLSATLWTSEKTTSAKSMVPVLVSEQSLSYAMKAISLPTQCCENDTVISGTLHFIQQ